MKDLNNKLNMKTIVFSLISCILGLMGCKEPQKNKQEPASLSAVVSESPLMEKPEIIPIEHATAVISWGATTVYIDPVGGAAAFKDQSPPDLILITDIHGDHLNVETLEALDTSKANFIVPKAVADLLPGAFASKIAVLDNGASIEHQGIKVEAIPMYNLREEAKEFHVKGRGNGYVLEKDGMRLYFSGDTEDIPEMRALKNIDMAFICMNLPYTMTVESAADAVLEFAPKQVYPYHFRGRPEISDVGKFKALVNAGDANIEVVQLDWYPSAEY